MKPDRSAKRGIDAMEASIIAAAPRMYSTLVYIGGGRVIVDRSMLSKEELLARVNRIEREAREAVAEAERGFP